MCDHQFEIAGTAYVGSPEDGMRECSSVVAYTPTGAEVWLYVDKETGELLHAERIDGEWTDVDIQDAAEEFADLYCI